MLVHGANGVSLYMAKACQGPSSAVFADGKGKASIKWSCLRDISVLGSNVSGFKCKFLLEFHPTRDVTLQPPSYLESLPNGIAPSSLYIPPS